LLNAFGFWLVVSHFSGCATVPIIIKVSCEERRSGILLRGCSEVDRGALVVLQCLFELQEAKMTSSPELGGALGLRGDQLFNLKWKNHQNHIMSVFDKILLTETFSDVSLVCVDLETETTQAIKAHKIILGASSPYFEMVFGEHPTSQPVVVVMPSEVKIEDLQHVLHFIYKGEVQVPQDQVQPVLRCARQLKIKGLDFDNSRESSLEPERPSSQQSGSSKRKSSPKFHFLKNRRKNLLPSKVEEIRADGRDEEIKIGEEIKSEDHDTVHDDNQSVQEDEGDRWGMMGCSSPNLPEDPVDHGDVESEGPVDFTIRSDNHSNDQTSQIHADMAAFLVAARNHSNFQEMLDPPPTMVPTSSSLPSPNPPFPSFHKTYTKRDMSLALEALRTKKLSLSRASEVYGIPPTTLWQRANRLGIPTPKKESNSKTWTEEDLQSALQALRNKEISANKASKVYKIPSSTLYKIARKEGIELAQPFNAVATAWNQDDLSTALEAIRGGMAVQKAASEYGIPSGTLYGRCKKVGIELSKHTQVHWSEDDMALALETVRTGTMSINQAAINYHLPYSSLYGRINRLKREHAAEWAAYRDHEFEPGEYDDSEHTNGMDYSGFLRGPYLDYDDGAEPTNGSSGLPEGSTDPASAAALLHSLATHGANNS